MAKCKRCGKWGLFLKLDKDGNCVACQRELAEQREAELRRQREEEKRRREEKHAAFWKEMDELPRAEIHTDGKKHRAQPISYIKDEISYARVTKRSNPAKFADFVVLDTETTGLSCTKDAVLEVAAIKVKSYKFIEVFHTMITPPPQKLETASAKEAMSINGITPEMLEGAPALYQIIPSLQEFIGDMPLLGHNLEFDLKFLCRAGLDITIDKRKFFDSYVLAGSILKKPKWEYDSELGCYSPNYDKPYDISDYKLDTLCRYYAIDRADEHRALGDCIDTARVFRCLLQEKIDTTEDFDA